MEITSKMIAAGVRSYLMLSELGTIVTPETLHRWHGKRVVCKWP